MDGTVGMDEARALVGDALLWPRVRDFLWDFAPSIHESWIEGRFGGFEDWMSGDSRKTSKRPNVQASKHLKKALLDALEVAPCFHTFPKDDGSRLLLLDAATLDAIAKWLGALACADALRKVTDGATVRNLKAALPGVYPEVFGFAAYFRGLDVLTFGSLDDFEGDTADKIVTAGYAILSSSMANLPAPLLHRLSLKLPRHLQLAKLQNFKTSNPLSQQVLRKLLKLRFPEAYSLCC